MTLKKALEEMARPDCSEQRRWELLAMVLREMALAKGIDVEHEFEE